MWHLLNIREKRKTSLRVKKKKKYREKEEKKGKEKRELNFYTSRCRVIRANQKGDKKRNFQAHYFGLIALIVLAGYLSKITVNYIELEHAAVKVERGQRNCGGGEALVVVIFCGPFLVPATKTELVYDEQFFLRND